MNDIELRSKLFYLERKSKKYGFLTTLTDEQITKLKDILEKYKLMKIYDYNGELNINNISTIKNKFIEKNVNYKIINSSKTTKIIKDIIDNELKNVYNLEKELNDIINIKYILDYELIKNKVLKNNILTDENDILKITNNNNKFKIKKINDFINKINFINKNTLEKHILHEEKDIILDIENKINNICYKLNIEVKGKTYKEKYYEILEFIKTTINDYKELLNDLNKINDKIINVENGLSREMKKCNVDLKLTFDEIKELSQLDLIKLVSDIKNYEESKKQLTDESSKIFKS